MKVLLMTLLITTNIYGMPIQIANGKTILFAADTDTRITCTDEHYEDHDGDIEQDAKEMCLSLSGSGNVLSLHDIVRGKGQTRRYTQDMQMYFRTECFVRWTVVCEVTGKN